MVFSSVIFLFLFLPAVFFFYFICPKRFLWARNMILLLFSMAFYFYGEPKYILVMLFSITVNYAAGLFIHNCQIKGKEGRAFLYMTVALNLLVLIYFKYLTFIMGNVNALLGSKLTVSTIIMPIGISFFTFQGMSYVFDVYNQTADVQKNPFYVALYISLFPQLIAGPIVRYQTVAEEIGRRVSDADKMAQGMIRFIYGFAKKIIIANSMALIADRVFAVPTEHLTACLAWIGAFAYSFQIYYDFSGYSDMAIGLGKVFGFSFLENFNDPYISKSITEFWRRWHMSLGTWFRDYVYIPLGGNKGSMGRQIGNIAVVWLLTGLWHGASWNFALWGIYFAFILIIEKTFLLKLLAKCPAFVSRAYALILIVIGWVIFRSDHVTQALHYTKRMFHPASLFVLSGQAYYLLYAYRFIWIAAILFSTPFGKYIMEKIKSYENSVLFYILRLGYVFSVFFLSILYLISATFNPFIYFRF